MNIFLNLLIWLGGIWDRFLDAVVILMFLIVGFILYFTLFINHPYIFTIIWGIFICAFQYYRHHNC